MGKYFGTDGFRGEANKNLTFEHAVQIGRFLGWYFGENMGKKAKVVVRALHRPYGKRSRRLHYARNHNSLGCIHHKNRRF